MMENIKEAAAEMLTSKMNVIMSEIATDMKNTLIDERRLDTGALVQSIKSGVERKGDTITGYVDIGAESEEGAWYAEFIEFGTGKYNPPNGRTTPWIWEPKPGSKYYKVDKYGNVVKYRTEGMEATPFIRPSVSAHIGELENAVKESYDLKRYRGMKS
jgi:HK97 gp10 family phage protein